ncbi:hypothetical protein [Pectobacterium brasiliense]|uniref:hypothetical protein n=1 Tax=Pectobacterium brasiliense TaxID=180957 RepID=UPI001968B89F|nr:hypothetical protein [Pectobacterium brasiliense]MBN3261559.1 hypothetical protein [Pectobacterium brasiliense]
MKHQCDARFYHDYGLKYLLLRLRDRGIAYRYTGVRNIIAWIGSALIKKQARMKLAGFFISLNCRNLLELPKMNINFC